MKSARLTATDLPMLEPYYLWIILLPVTVVLSAELLVGSLGLYPIEVGGLRLGTSAHTDYQAIESALRLRVLGLFLLLVVGTFAIVTRFEAERRNHFHPDTAKLLLVGAFICFGTAIAIIALSGTLLIPASFDVLGRDVFARAFALASKYPIFFAETSKIMPNSMTESTLWWLMNVGGLFVGAAIATLIMSAISSLAQNDQASLEAQKAHWKLQTERLQLTVYISTALLVVGLLYIQTWAQWPTFAFISGKSPPDPAATNYAALLNSYLAYTGIEYSILLASFVVPVTVFLNRQADQIAIAGLRTNANNNVTSTKSRTVVPSAQFNAAVILAERKKENLVVQFIDQLKTIIAILAPFAAGSIGNFVTLLSAKS